MGITGSHSHFIRLSSYPIDVMDDDFRALFIFEVHLKYKIEPME